MKHLINKLFVTSVFKICSVTALATILVGEARATSKNVSWPIDAEGRTATLSIPAQWINPKDSISQDTSPAHIPSDLFLQALLPNVVPWTYEERAAFDVAGGGELTTLLLRSLAIADYHGTHYDQLKSRIDYAVKELKHVCVRDYERPVNSIGATKCVDLEAAAEKSGEFGLRRYGVNFNIIPMAQDQMMLYNDMLIEEDGTRTVKTMISCTAGELANVRSRWTGSPAGGNCTEFFNIESLNAFAAVTYNEKYLANWREIRKQWTSTIESFITLYDGK